MMRRRLSLGEDSLLLFLLYQQVISMSRKHLFISFLFLCFYTAKTQDFYRMEGNILFKYDLNTSCEGVEEFDFKNSDLEVIPNNIPIHFRSEERRVGKESRSKRGTNEKQQR